MPLDDKFYPNPEGFGATITYLDNLLIKGAGKVGEAYQQFTGLAYKSLATGSKHLSFLIAAVGSLPFIASNPPGFHVYLIPFAPLGVLFHNSLPNAGLEFESPVQEEIRLESKNRSKYYNKIIRFVNSILALPLIYISKEVFSNPNFPYSLELGLLFAAYAITDVTWQFAQYLSKSNIPKPPDKSLLEKGLDFLRPRGNYNPFPQSIKH